MDPRYKNVGTADRPDYQLDSDPNVAKKKTSSFSKWRPAAGDLYSPEWEQSELDRRTKDVMTQVSRQYAGSRAGGVVFGNERAMAEEGLAKIKSGISEEATRGVARRQEIEDQRAYNLGLEYGFPSDSPYADAVKAVKPKGQTVQVSSGIEGQPFTVPYELQDGESLQTVEGRDVNGGFPSLFSRKTSRVVRGDAFSNTPNPSASSYGFSGRTPTQTVQNSRSRANSPFMGRTLPTASPGATSSPASPDVSSPQEPGFQPNPNLSGYNPFQRRQPTQLGRLPQTSGRGLAYGF